MEAWEPLEPLVNIVFIGASHLVIPCVISQSSTQMASLCQCLPLHWAHGADSDW